MAFGLYEYPHTDFYDSDLSEVLKYYRKLVDEYNEIVEKMRDAQRQWQESMDYVEKWNVKWQHDMQEMRVDFRKLVDEIVRTQQELINRFETERLSITSYMNDVLQQIKQNNWDTLDEIDDKNSKQLNEIDKRLTEFRANLQSALDAYQEMLNTSLNNIEQRIANNLIDFKNFVKDEMDTVMSLFESYETTVNRYHQETEVMYDNLLKQYKRELQIAKDDYAKQLNNQYIKITREYSNDDDTVLRIMETQYLELKERIEEVDKARVDIQADKVLVLSPITKVYKRIQWVLDEMWTFFGVWAIEAGMFDNLHITAEQFDNWIANPSKLPNRVGIEALEFDAMARWILLEKPDIVGQLQDEIKDITYNALSENKDRIEQEVLTETIATATSYFAGIVNTVTVIAGKLQPMQDEIDGVKGRVDVLEVTASTISSTVDRLVTTTSILNARIDNADINIETLTQLQEAMDEDIGNITGTLSDATLTINSNGNFTIRKG